jgi:hypothetical protein
VIKSLHISPPNSDCIAGVHDGLPGRGKSSRMLDVRLCLGSGSILASSRGLRSGDGSAEIDGPPGGHVCYSWQDLLSRAHTYGNTAHM